MELLDPPTQPPLEPPASRHRATGGSRRSRWSDIPGWFWLAFAMLVLGLVVGLVLLRSDPEPPVTPASAPVVPISTPAAPPVADLPEGSFAGDGGPGDVQVYVVGKHIQPGSYATAGALDPRATPRWEILRFRSEGDVPRRYRGGEPVGPVTVTLEIGDIFETTGYRPWARTPEAEEE